jgi:quercetin dioxygenase-like cupin family protein
MSDAVPVALGPDGGRTFSNPLGGGVTMKLSAAETGGSLNVFESVVDPGEGPPVHLHVGEDEAMYVVEGTVRFKLGEKLDEMSAGGLAFIPRGLPHAWQNVGTGRARLLFSFAPASPGMEEFFAALAEVPADGPWREEFARLGSKAGMEVVGPPLTQSDPL